MPLVCSECLHIFDVVCGTKEKQIHFVPMSYLFSTWILYGDIKKLNKLNGSNHKKNCDMQTRKTWLMTLQVEYLNADLKVSAQEEHENAL